MDFFTWLLRHFSVLLLVNPLLRVFALRPSSYAGTSAEPIAGRVWPLPKTVDPQGAGGKLRTIDHERHQIVEPTGCQSQPEVAGCRALKAAAGRYQALFFPHHADADSLSFLQIEINNSLRSLRKRRRALQRLSAERLAAVTQTVLLVADLAAPLGLDANESYEVNVPAEGSVVLSAQTAWGALRGLETLSQLVDFNFTTESYAFQDVPFRIQDEPRFPHRGLLVDSARHFLPVPRLKQTILAMSFAKLNVLHWHLTEDESFSMPSALHPELAEKGAWSANERYTLRDVRGVVDFAMLHGIRVIPEFDMPGHVTSWSKSHPELFDPRCLETSKRLAFLPTAETFTFLESLLQEWTTGPFPDQFVHLGSDEVPEECYHGSSVGDGSHRIAGPRALFQHFITSMTARVRGSLNRSVILWDEAFVSAKISNETVVQVWRNKATLAAAARSGHRVLLSWGWYLDHLDEGWQGMYENDPLEGVDEGQELVLGGEACMWGETVDGSDQAATLWPRLAAVAERLWSSPDTKAETAASRLEAYRCLLLQRGVAAAPVHERGRAAPEGPGSCQQRTGNWGLLA
mmetsp:Transcript_9588/g.17811  ORF Transcript_9588/g.17811 Transcript_9588/m.17811 type:complete len:574 (+) Transcript_9588:42-1763(+)